MNAAEPIGAIVPGGAERHQRNTAESPAPRHPKKASQEDASAALRESLAKILPPLPPPPDPPGTAYVAAVLSGALSPKPTSAQEVYRRVGEWTPPESSLHLADKTI